MSEKRVDAKTLLQDIYDRIGARRVFKNNQKDLVRLLNDVFSELTFRLLMRPDVLDEFSDQYRAVLKIIMLYSPIGVDNCMSDVEIMKDLIPLFEEFSNGFTPVRNYLEQCSLGQRKIIYKDGIYDEPSYNNSSDYTRIADRYKENRAETLSNQLWEKIGEFVREKPFSSYRNQKYIPLMIREKEYQWEVSEIKDGFKFADFEYTDLISFCSALNLIAGHCFYYDLAYKAPGRIVKESDLISGIRYLSKLNEDTVRFFLKYMTYDINYQKDKLTLIQPFVKYDDMYYFSPYQVFRGYLPIKLFRVITDQGHDKYERNISVLSKQKEEYMLNELSDMFSKYNVDVSANYKLWFKGSKYPTAEYDLLTYDNDTNKLYAIECKWYGVGDGERDHRKFSNHIKEAVDHRVEQDELLRENISKVMKENFESKPMPTEVISIMISRNFMGLRDFAIPVADIREVTESVELCDSFDSLMKRLMNRQFREEVALTNKKITVEIEGYKIASYRIIVKR